LKLLLRLLARLPLRASQALGVIVGRLVYALSPRYRDQLLENVSRSGVLGREEDLARFAHRNAEENGKGLVELAYERGLILYARRTRNGLEGDHFLVCPPMITTESQIDEIMQPLKASLDALADDLRRFDRAN